MSDFEYGMEGMKQAAALLVLVLVADRVIREWLEGVQA